MTPSDQLVENLLSGEQTKYLTLQPGQRVRKGMTVEVTSGTGDDKITWRGIVMGRLRGGTLMTRGSWIGNESEGNYNRDIQENDPTLRILDIPIDTWRN